MYEKVQHELLQYYNNTISLENIVVLDSSGLKGKYFEN